MEVFIAIICLIPSILVIICFFKVWGMTNNVSRILKILQDRDIPVITPSKPDKTTYIYIDDIVRLNINGKRFKVVGIDNGRYICEDILGIENTTYKFRKDEITKE